MPILQKNNRSLKNTESVFPSSQLIKNMGKFHSL